MQKYNKLVQRLPQPREREREGYGDERTLIKPTINN